MRQVESSKKALIFDTSGVNALAEDMKGAMARAVGIGYFVKITGTNVAELGATSDSSQRKRLVSTLRFLSSSGTCLIPSRWVIRGHSEKFLNDPDRYDWQQLDVRSRGTEKVIADDRLLDDENSGVLKAENKELEKQFEDLHRSERTRFDELMGNEAPATFKEYCSIVLQDGGPAWSVGVSMFKQVLIEIDEARASLGLPRMGVIKPRFSKTVGEKYVSQGCAHCDALVGQFPLREDFITIAGEGGLPGYECKMTPRWPPEGLDEWIERHPEVMHTYDGDDDDVAH